MTTKTILLHKKFKLIFNSHVRKLSSKPKFQLTDEVENLVKEEEIKPRKHPGIIKNNVTELPKWLVKAIDQSLDDVNRSQILKERLQFSNYLFSRRLPVETTDAQIKYSAIEQKYLGDVMNLSKEEILQKRKQLQNQVNFELKTKIFAWKPMEYSPYKSLLYLITRCTGEYSVLSSIFNEIQTRDVNFKPRTVFDFGSGVGSVLWAASEKWTNINEYLGIDISNDMNDLALKIINHKPSKIKGIYHRQYLPVSKLKYDLVVSAYSLIELPDAKNRLAVISKLWNKTQNYLVIIEQGTNAGFRLINEARDIINYIEKKNKKSQFFTFAPCPHDMKCPRYKEGTTPCNFLARHMSLPILGPSSPKEELYSYIVMKKGERQENDNWPRCVRKTLRRSKHVWCHLCTAKGKLEQICITPSAYGKAFYKCAKASKWGHRLPAIQTSFVETNKDQNLSHESEESQCDNEKKNVEDEIKEISVSEAPVDDVNTKK